MRLIDIDSESFLNEMRSKQDAVKELIHNSDDNKKTWTERDHWEGIYGVFVEIALTLRAQPIINAELVKHGEWIKTPGYCTPGGDPVWHCSLCGKGLHTYGIEHGSYGRDVADKQWIACPNCGAVMEENI